MVLNRFLLFLLLSILAPHRVWGFSLERTASYKKYALEKRLAETSQWLRLGHYHPSIFGAPKSKLRGDFFLAPSGAKDPEAELLATLDHLFTENNKQCRYLARMDWLKSVLPLVPEDIQPCPERDEWKKKLGAKEVSIIFASSDLSSPASSFGHTFLKFHNPANTRELELLDYGVNYAAVTGSDSGAFFALKGVFGFYPGNYSMLPYHQKIREYTNLEGRDLWEYKLKISAEEVEFLIDHLLELEGSYSDYYFADENCSYQLLELLNIVRPDWNLTQSFYDFVIPLDSLRVLNDLNLLADEKLRTSLQSEWRARFAGLNLSQKSELRKAVQEPRAFSFDIELPNKEKAQVLEATLSYIAIQEYREQKEFKEDKYALSVARAKLGRLTEQVMPQPSQSPLLSQRAMGIYAGFGQIHEKKYLSVKYRRGFHDLLADDTGTTPFLHLEALSFEFRYFTENKNLDLAHFTALNILSTAPVNILDHPVSWNLDFGTKPKLSPYFDGGIGFSFDLSQKNPTRFITLARIENRTEQEKYSGYAGAQMLLITRWNQSFRSLLGAKYLYSFKDKESFWDHQAGLSLSHGAHELRLESMNRRNNPDLQTSYIYYF